MIPAVRRRLVIISGVGALFILTLYLVMTSFKENLIFFYSPTELLLQERAEQKVRLGGLVRKGSIKILSETDHRLSFEVTDKTTSITVDYQGFLPDLFREGQGVVAEGLYDRATHTFKATQILAKHDETYKPPLPNQEFNSKHGEHSIARE